MDYLTERQFVAWRHRRRWIRRGCQAVNAAVYFLLLAAMMVAVLWVAGGEIIAGCVH